MTALTPVRPAATFIILGSGRLVTLLPDWQQIMGFAKARIVACVTPIERTIEDGGTYRLERLDGPEDLRDLRHDMHRKTFVPRSYSHMGRWNHQKQERA